FVAHVQRRRCFLRSQLTTKLVRNCEFLFQTLAWCLADFPGELPMKTILDEYAKRCAQGNGVCPAWRDGKYPKMCACLQQNESEYRWFSAALLNARVDNRLGQITGEKPVKMVEPVR